MNSSCTSRATSCCVDLRTPNMAGSCTGRPRVRVISLYWPHLGDDRGQVAICDAGYEPVRHVTGAAAGCCGHARLEADALRARWRPRILTLCETLFCCTRATRQAA